MLLSESNLSYDEIKKVVFCVIKGNEFHQYEDIVQGVIRNLLEHNLIKGTNSWSVSQNYKEISESDGILINEIVWDLIIARVLTIGYNKDNDEWPFLRLTEFGNKEVKESIPIHDVDGLIQSIEVKIPHIDSIIIRYLGECLNTYRIGTLLASSVMLGCATEKAVVLLIESYSNWLKDKGEIKEFEKFNNGKNKAISRRFDEFNKSFVSHKADIPSEYYEDFDIVINSVFTIIRKNRNDAGHPTGNEIDRNELALWIHVFNFHCKRIYDLVDFFQKSS